MWQYVLLCQCKKAKKKQEQMRFNKAKKKWEENKDGIGSKNEYVMVKWQLAALTSEILIIVWILFFS